MALVPPQGLMSVMVMASPPVILTALWSLPAIPLVLSTALRSLQATPLVLLTALESV
ncbi:hypothetical protein D3C76_1861520 [compost metagenome]